MNAPIITPEMLENDGSVEFPPADEFDAETYETCVCNGGKDYGHYNEAGGYCCPHYGNTCGYHQEYH